MATQQMISSSSSSYLVPLKKYDVFLSFRGEDTRKNFTSHLYNALIQKKIETFIDDNELQKGDEISPALIKAIKESHVFIVIFSKNYASSKWCLNELIQILECCKNDERQTVLPIFYDIDPSHVRKQTGSYDKAFRKHERDLNLNKDELLLQQWKDALANVANLAGWDSRNYRNESDLIKEILENVLQKIMHIYPHEVKGLVEIVEKCKEIESILKIGSNEVIILGLWGMGGIGKTTLAKILCNKLCHQFESYCFLENIKEESSKYGLNVVQHKLLSVLLGEENLRFDASYVENHWIMRKFANKKVFIVLDCVTTLKQIKELFIVNNCLGPGSRVVITTRDKQICSALDECVIYEVEELSKENSVELFSLIAFGEKHPKIGYEKLSKSVLNYCNENPLALKVLGARFRSRNKEVWKSDLKKLQKFSDVNIHNVLKLSYDDLDDTQKNILLDIACFFNGEERGRVTSLLEASDFFAVSGIQVLVDKAFITILGDKIIMHDLIKEMGHEIIRQECTKHPGKRSRLWESGEVYHVLKYNKGTEDVEGIKFNCDEVEGLYLSSDSFKKMINLRYLDIYKGGVYFPDGLELLPDCLRYFRWSSFPLESLPSTFCAKMLVELHMPDSNLKKLWEGVQDLVNLTIIRLDRSIHLMEMPDLSRATNLEVLTLSNCHELRELLPSVLSLPKLELLDLRCCRKIKSLRSNTHSKSLSFLNLSDCSSLREFSVISEEMRNLCLRGTCIREFPSCIWRNTKLTSLDLGDCGELIISGKKLLSDDERLGFLVLLKLSGCTQMDALSLGVLLNNISSLKELNLSGCCNLEAIPDNIQKYSMLEKLVLDDCTKLVFSLRELLLPSLEDLRAVNCTANYMMDTSSTQRFVENMLQKKNLKRRRYHKPYLFLPRIQVPSIFYFHTTNEASITIPLISKPDLCGFFFCVILSQGLCTDRKQWLECSIYQHYKRCFELHEGTLTCDHVLLSWVDYNDCGGDKYNLSFEFKLPGPSDYHWSTEGIKGCAVLPIYDTRGDNSLRLMDATTTGSGVEIVESEFSYCTAQASHHQSLPPRVVGISEVVEGSTNEKDHQQPSYSPKQELQEKEEDLIVKSSCDCSIGLFLKHWLGILSKQVR